MILLPLLIGVVAFAVVFGGPALQSFATQRSGRPKLPNQRDALLAGLAGENPEAAVDAYTAEMHTGVARRQDRASRLEALSTERAERFNEHGVPLLSGVGPLWRRIVVNFFLASIGVSMFVANVGLESAVFAALGFDPWLVILLSGLVPSLCLLLGTVMFDAMRPEPHLPVVSSLSRAAQKLVAIAALVGLSAIIGVLVRLSPVRTEHKYERTLATARTSCPDRSANTADCVRLATLERRIEHSELLDRAIAIGVPSAETIGMVGLLPAIEITGALCMRRRATRAQRRHARAVRRVARQTAKEYAVLSRAIATSPRSAELMPPVNALFHVVPLEVAALPETAPGTTPAETESVIADTVEDVVGGGAADAGTPTATDGPAPGQFRGDSVRRRPGDPIDQVDRNGSDTDAY